MVALDKIDAVVAAFAKATKIFITPQHMGDPLVPPASTLTDDIFASFFTGLLSQFASASIQIKLPSDDLRKCQTWQDVSVVCFHHQI